MNTSWSGQHEPFPTTIRTAILRRDPTCRCTGCPQCTPTGCNQTATEADHILGYTECRRTGINPHTLNNGQGLCHPCHTVKTKAQAAAGRARLKPRRTPPTHPSDAA